MANETKKLVDLSLLGYYDSKIKDWTEGAYKIVEQATAEDGYLKTYALQVNGVDAADSVKINIPKDFMLKGAEIKTCTVADEPIAGLKVGDKYFDFTINVADASATATHVYLAVKDVFQAYVEGDGITITGQTIAAKLGTGLEINATSKAIDLVAQSSNAGAPAIGGITTADYAGFKGAADTFTATAGTATAGTAVGNVTPYTQTITVASTDVGGTETADAFHFDLQWKEYGNATATSGQTAAAAGLMSGTDKDNLDAIVEALGTDLDYATNADVDALFA